MTLKFLINFILVVVGILMIPFGELLGKPQINADIASSAKSLKVKVDEEKGKSSEIENHVPTSWIWNFNKPNDSEGWTIPEPIYGVVLGGAVWLTIRQEVEKIKPLRWQQQIWGANAKYDLISPKGLAIPACQVKKVRMRILNLSPETDGFVYWRTADNPEVDVGHVRFTMKPDCQQWQEVICHIDNRWQGTIDHIKIRPASQWWRGDMWIDWIAITDGECRATNPRPDLCSEKVVPHIVLPGISQQEFQDAFKVLDECLVVDVPLRGFNYPFLAPGGAYGENWWQLDGSLNVAGAKWVNQKFVENAMRGFAEVQAQNPDGRIDLWGGSPVRGQVANVSSLPRYFEAAFDVARRSKDRSLQELIFHSMKKYLAYWLSPVKRDERTGLIGAVFEETFSHPYDDLTNVAPVDLNVAVAIGCYNTARLAEQLGLTAEAQQYSEKFHQLCDSINRYLWNEDENAFNNFYISQAKHCRRLICTTFDPLRLCIAQAEKIHPLIPKLLNPSLFNWGSRPVTSIAKTEADYVEATGPYDGRAWYGDVWTMRNMSITAGLEDAGYHDLAAELNWSTILTFNANYAEYVVPGTGSGEGVQRYGWSASQYIQAIIEHLFGIDYDCLEGRLRIVPHIPKNLFNKEISISNLILPTENEARLFLSIKQLAPAQANISIKNADPLPLSKLEVFLPNEEKYKVKVQNDSGQDLPVLVQADGLLNIVGVQLAMTTAIKLDFRVQ